MTPERRALERIGGFHTPTSACGGCGCIGCLGDCDWSGDVPEPELMVCSFCCTSPDAPRERTDDCIGSHEHAAGRAICAHTEILTEAGL